MTCCFSFLRSTIPGLNNRNEFGTRKLLTPASLDESWLVQLAHGITISCSVRPLLSLTEHHNRVEISPGPEKKQENLAGMGDNSGERFSGDLPTAGAVGTPSNG